MAAVAEWHPLLRIRIAKPQVDGVAHNGGLPQKCSNSQKVTFPYQEAEKRRFNMRQAREHHAQHIAA